MFRTKSGVWAAIVNGKRFEGSKRDVERFESSGIMPQQDSDEIEGPIKCVNCGRVQAVVRLVDLFHCSHCGAEFDSEPDEGGDYFDDPTKRSNGRKSQKTRRR